MFANWHDKADEIIKDKVIAEYPLIKVREGNCRLNQRCHQNSVHEAIMAGEKKLAMVMSIEKSNGRCILHYVNINENGEYYDNTLGVWARTYDYYFIRDISENEFFEICSIFNNALAYFRRTLPWYIRWFTNYRI